MKTILTTPLIPLICAALMVCGCRQAKMARLAKTMMEHEIIIPDSLKLLNEDFIDESAMLETDGKYKLIVSIPKEQCTSCRISAHELLDSLLCSTTLSVFVPMVILDQPDETEIQTIKATIEKFRLEFPIYLDSSSGLFNLNPFIPDDEVFHSFLLDRSNRVILIGDPTTDYNMMKLYQKVLADKFSSR